ncbi:MAG: Holliday junction resolvase RuvX [Prevotella sp.]|jgi:putative Holliday junction resolvase|nr:Holliday junction resolvase RuvX [Prevotella sp.]
MGRIVAIDYGRRRCGIAATDILRLVPGGIATVSTSELTAWLRRYTTENDVDMIVVGQPRDMRGNDSESMRYIRPGVAALRRALPSMPVVFFDERFTSVLAHRAMIDGGMPKMRRRDKAVVDEIAATIILSDFLVSQQYKSMQ